LILEKIIQYYRAVLYEIIYLSGENLLFFYDINAYIDYYRINPIKEYEQNINVMEIFINYF